MVVDSPPLYRPPTVEEAWDDDAEYIPLGNRSPAANVAAKRSRPELDNIKDMMKDNPKKAGAAKDGKGVQDAKNLMKQMAGLSIDTSVPDRPSRPYASGPTPEPRGPEPRGQEPRPPPEPRPQSTTGSKTRRQSSKTEKPKGGAFKHAQGTCWVCDRHGSHVFNPEQQQQPSNDVVPYGMPPGFQQLAIANGPPSKSKKSRSSNARPPSFCGVPNGFPNSAHPMSPPGWPVPGTPMGYPDHYQVPASAYPYYQGYSQPFPSSYGQQALLEAGPSSDTSNVLAGSNPKASYFDNQLPLTRKTSSKEYSRDAPRSKAEDTKRMPPPSSVPIQRRESTTRSTALTGKSRERPVSVFSPMSTSPFGSSDRRFDPPSSFREFPSKGQPAERPALKSSTTYADPITSLRGGAGPKLDRRTTAPRVERFEKEAEAYQKSKSSRASDLTTDAIGQFSRHSDEGSQRSFNSSSRGSSGGKTKSQAADFTMTVKDLTLNLSGPGAEKVQILPGANGGFDIRPLNQDDNVPRRSSSASSWSKPRPSEDSFQSKDGWGWDAGPFGSLSNDVDWGTGTKPKANEPFDDWGSKIKPTDDRGSKIKPADDWGSKIKPADDWGGRGKPVEQEWIDTSRTPQTSAWDEVWDPGPTRPLRDKAPEPDRARKLSRDRGRDKGVNGRDPDQSYDLGWPNSNRPVAQESRGKRSEDRGWDIPPSAPDFWDSSQGGADDWGTGRSRQDEPKRWEDNTPKGRGNKNSREWGDDSSKGWGNPSKGWEDNNSSIPKNWEAEDKSWGNPSSRGWNDEPKGRKRDEPKGWGNDSKKGNGGGGGWSSGAGGGGRGGGGGGANPADEW